MTDDTVATTSLEARLHATPTSAAWAVVDAVDPHRCYAGRISEVRIGDRTMLRIALLGDQPYRTVILSPGFVRDILPCTEAEAHAEAALHPHGRGPPPFRARDGGDDEPF